MSTYSSTAQWTKGRNGIVSTESVHQQVAFSAPAEFHGEPGAWTPEHFLTAAVAGCFVTTFMAIAELSQFEVISLEVNAEGFLEKVDRGFQFTRVLIRPVLTIAEGADQERGLRLIEKAERSCLIARSLRSEVVVEPRVFIQAPVAA
jgi:peroxiredoxin-like protein